jgi:hypothetical protein
MIYGSPLHPYFTMQNDPADRLGNGAKAAENKGFSGGQPSVSERP